jgi:hypothetical protein
MSKWSLFFTLNLALLVIPGCQHGNHVRGISSGSHVLYSDEKWREIENKTHEKLRFIVWGNHAGAVSAAIAELQRNHQTVVERARLQEIFDEQKIRLTHSSDDDSSVLKAGRLVGADRVIFIEASDRPQLESGYYVGPYGGAGRSNTVHQVSVAARAVAIESGEVKWSGHSTFSTPISDPEAGIPILTQAAMGRAVCPLERGRVWIEPGENGPNAMWGCKAKEK